MLRQSHVFNLRTYRRSSSFCSLHFRGVYLIVRSGPPRTAAPSIRYGLDRLPAKLQLVTQEGVSCTLNSCLSACVGLRQQNALRGSPLAAHPSSPGQKPVLPARFPERRWEPADFARAASSFSVCWILARDDEVRRKTRPRAALHRRPRGFSARRLEAEKRFAPYDPKTAAQPLQKKPPERRLSRRRPGCGG